jgi:hypothetical protein
MLHGNINLATPEKEGGAAALTQKGGEHTLPILVISDFRLTIRATLNQT